MQTKKLLYKICFTLMLFSIFLFNANVFAKNLPTIYPAKLQPGDTVGLVAPGYRVPEDSQIQYAIERMQALGLKVKLGKAIYKRYGYFAGTDEERAKDINQMFLDPEVKAIIALRGGWGCSRILNMLDYKMIKKHPKIIMGYSDLTALLLAIHAKTGLITFHGPMPAEPWTKFSTQYVKDILFDAKVETFDNPVDADEDDLIHTENRIITLNGGKASGPLFGGSLTVLTSLLGSNYLPKFNGGILFVEDVNEDIYRIDRMMMQLKTAGILDHISGFVFGKCTDCKPGDNSTSSPYGSFTLQQVLENYIKPLHIPAFYGSMIGHDEKIFTLPEGAPVTIDADKGEIEMLNSAVK